MERKYKVSISIIFLLLITWFFIKQTNDKKEIGIEVIGPTKNVIEKIFEKYNYQASKIDRVYYGGLTKKNIARKESRFLTEEEISILKRQ